MSDGSRLAAIQLLAEMVLPDDEAQFDEYAEKLTVCLITLGVSVPEIHDAMDFAILSGREDLS